MTNMPPIDPSDQPNQAADLIRQKVANIYGEEPDAKLEAREAKNLKSPSKHQAYMQKLVNSGKTIPQIQTEWHQYYVNLNENEKLQVWDEFYAGNQTLAKAADSSNQPQHMARLKNEVIANNRYQPKSSDKRTTGQIKNVIRSKITADGQIKAKHHVQSLLFGLGLGSLVIIIFLFGFFNEIIIAPFIQPSRDTASTPVIVGDSAIAPTSTPEVIIPKINVEIPVDYTETSTNESTIENDLEAGVVHYPTTVEPGQLGNAAFFGHSSNNIFNPGKYKFAFVLLHTIVNGDTFYLTYNHTVYIYKVISTQIVSPSDVGVLGPVSGQTATATLITCDPPGTSINRLVVVGQQISPNPAADTTGAPIARATSQVNSLPGNGPSLWTRFINSPEGKIVPVSIGIVVIVVVFRRISKRRG